MDHEKMSETLKSLHELLEKIPFTDEVKARIAELRQLVGEQRAPRLAVVGRRGAGKSSLFNAMVDKHVLAEGVTDTTTESQWMSIPLKDGSSAFDWLDTPGLGAGKLKGDRLTQLKHCIAEKRPDVILFAHKASEVDAEIDSTLDDLAQLVKLTEFEGKTTHVLVVLTQVDQLPSPMDSKPPYKAGKLEAIATVTDTLRAHMQRKGIAISGVIPVAAYFDEDIDARYNIDQLSDHLGRLLPLQAQIEAARNLAKAEKLRHELAENLVNICAAVAGGIAAVPIPFSDIVPLTALQVTMISSIGYLGGDTLSKSAIQDFMIGIGGVVAAGTTLRTLLKLVPFGVIASVPVAVAATKAMGRAATALYIDLIPMVQVKAEFMKWRNKL